MRRDAAALARSGQSAPFIHQPAAHRNITAPAHRNITRPGDEQAFANRPSLVASFVAVARVGGAFPEGSFMMPSRSFHRRGAILLAARGVDAVPTGREKAE
jgi:hypothetical protein